jgi:hypothetical protein
VRHERDAKLYADGFMLLLPHWDTKLCFKVVKVGISEVPQGGLIFTEIAEKLLERTPQAQTKFAATLVAKGLHAVEQALDGELRTASEQSTAMQKIDTSIRPDIHRFLSAKKRKCAVFGGFESNVQARKVLRGMGLRFSSVREARTSDGVLAAEITESGQNTKLKLSKEGHALSSDEQKRRARYLKLKAALRDFSL